MTNSFDKSDTFSMSFCFENKKIEEEEDYALQK